MEDASVRTFILQGQECLQYGQVAIDSFKKAAGNLAITNLVDLSPAHVNCARLYLGPIPQVSVEQIRRGLQAAANPHKVTVMYDDPLTYGAP